MQEKQAHLINNNKSKRVKATIFDETVDERVCLLYGGHIDTVLLASSWRHLSLGAGVFLDQKIQCQAKLTQSPYLKFQ